jgi:hypothetical protein
MQLDDYLEQHPEDRDKLLTHTAWAQTEEGAPSYDWVVFDIGGGVGNVEKACQHSFHRSLLILKTSSGWHWAADLEMR